ncbi:hypothetical protein [Actinomadura madurae]|uniref:hypothetical protein n=1 Tax=Actinomadura madurae TaxID=1993 RepID=UPI0020D1FAB7|nr:hypothetical protein [Actinomadura madurae]MCP9965192.1 hypothetical protein [Actinomadura madurae]MCQ0013865.1 hypothetical protein [Actinomadura madurae]
MRSRPRVPTSNSGAAFSEKNPEFADGRTQPGSVQSSPARTRTPPVTASAAPAPPSGAAPRSRPGPPPPAS